VNRGEDPGKNNVQKGKLHRLKKGKHEGKHICS